MRALLRPGRFGQAGQGHGLLFGLGLIALAYDDFNRYYRRRLAYALFTVVSVGDAPLLRQTAGSAQTFFDERQFRIREFPRPTGDK